MNGPVKRELVFYGVVALCVAAYLGLGHFLAPDVPPEPEKTTGKVYTLETFLEETRLRKQRGKADLERRRFLQRWYQWGAGGGIVLILIYSWWRPPWFQPAVTGAGGEDPSRPASTMKETRQTGGLHDGLSQQAKLTMIGTAVMLVVIAVLLLLAFTDR